MEFNLNTYSRRRDVFDAIDNIPYIYGSTNTADALQVMYTRMFTLRNGDRPGVPNVGILITDGVSNINSRRTIPEAVNARQAKIHIYAIGIGLTDTRELDAIASEPAAENSLAVQDFDELSGLPKRIFDAICPGSLTMYTIYIVFVKAKVNVYLMSKLFTRVNNRICLRWHDPISQ